MTDELDRLNPSRSAAKLGDKTVAAGTATGVVTGQTRSKRAKDTKIEKQFKLLGKTMIFFSLHKKRFYILI